MSLKHFLPIALIFLSSCSTARANVRTLDAYPYDTNGNDFLSFMAERSVRIEVSSLGNTPGRYVNVGTGAFISPDGLILTANHVLGERFTSVFAHRCVLEAEHSAIKCGEKEEAELVARDTPNDLALLRLKGNKRTEFFRLGNMNNVWRGDILWRIGMDDTGWAAGILLNPFAEGMRNRMEILMPARGGASGGPVIDSSGRLVGIVTSTPRTAVDVATFAVPIETARNGLLRNRLHRRVSR